MSKNIKTVKYEPLKNRILENIENRTLGKS